MLQSLGELQELVMAQLWQSPGPLTVREVRDRLQPSRPLAYTTVMTVLDKLTKKGFASRQAEGRTYLYSPVLSRAELAAQQMQAALSSSDDRNAALLRLVDRMEPDELAALRSALDETGKPGTSS